VVGSASFYDGSNLLGGHAVGVSGGTASYTTSTLSVGSHTIRVRYNGGAGLTASYNSLTQTVN